MDEVLVPKRARETYRRSRHKQRIDRLADGLLELGYSQAAVRFYVREWVRFAARYEAADTAVPATAADADVVVYLDRRLARREHGRGQIQRALRMFVEEDALDGEGKPETRRPPPLYDLHVPTYLAFVRRHRGRRTTHQLEDALGKFFQWLSDRGLADLGDIAARDVRDFLGSFPGRFRTTIATYASALRGFLRHAHMEGTLDADLSPAAEIPAGYRLSEPPDVVMAETIESLLALVDRSTSIGKRDYAMLLLAARCGLRPSDIRGLRFEHVRWRDRLIVIVQSKNQRALELPLPADVDAALVDYIRDRPRCSAREIFVRHVAPTRPFVSQNNLWHVMARALRTSGLKLGTRHRGMYVLRHSLAKRMLEQGVAFDTIKDVLGHASVDTTRRYAQVDLVGLRSVALPETELRK